MRTYIHILAAVIFVILAPTASANDVQLMQQLSRNLEEGCMPGDEGLICKILRKAESIVKYATNLAEDVTELCTSDAVDDPATREFCDNAF